MNALSYLKQYFKDSNNRHNVAVVCTQFNVLYVFSVNIFHLFVQKMFTFFFNLCSEMNKR